MYIYNHSYYTNIQSYKYYKLSKFFFYSPTDAQVNCLKTILKFTLELTWKQRIIRACFSKIK